ncbi:Hypothetical predicted protein, partial [Paramuricea clavata]
MSKNSLLKDLDAQTVVKFLENEKALPKPMSGVEKAKSWVGSSDFNMPACLSASMSSATDSRVFTPLETMIIEAVVDTLPYKASGRQCLQAIEKDKNCREQRISERFTEQQLKNK